MHSYCRYILPLLFASAVAARAQLTLPEAIATAVARHPELASARHKIAAATGRAVQARLWPNPEVELSSEDGPADGGGFAPSKKLIGLSQTVPFPGKKELDAHISTKEVTATEWEYHSREIELVRDVKTAFYSALAAQHKLAVGEELAALAKSTATAARKRVEAGAAGDQEQLRAEVEQERVGVELTAIRRELATARQTLAALVGRTGELAGELPAQVNRPVFDLARHPAIRAANVNREKAELELRRAKLEPMPDVRFGLAAGRNTAEHESVLELRVSVPLPIFDRAQGRQREAQALREIARCDLSATELRLTRELNLLDERLHAAGEQVEAYRTRILPKAEAAAKLVRTGFESGKFTLLDLLDTQRTTAEVRLAYYDKLLELNTAQAELEALVATEAGRDGSPSRPPANTSDGAPDGRALPTK
jgi:cobalt-zinc-cadmium efflux system outer membrane protein